MTSLTTGDVLRAEAEQVHQTELPDGLDAQSLALKLNELESSALCLSGGGIRSASFALGVIQALASWPRDPESNELPGPDTALLNQFHYLSTVSGGGYIGSWLSAWLHNEPYAKVLPLLQRHGGTADKVEPRPLGDLRRDSNYLTPRIGVFSADTWAAAAMLVRNLILNWLVLIPLILVSLIALKLLMLGVTLSAELPPLHSIAVLLLWGLLAAKAISFSIHAQMRRPAKGSSRNDPEETRRGPAETQFLVQNLLPMVAAGILWTAALDASGLIVIQSSATLAGDLLRGIFLGLGVYCAAGVWVLFLTRAEREVTAGKTLSRWFQGRSAWGWLVAGIVFGLSLGMAAGLTRPYAQEPVYTLLLLVFGVPWLLISQLVAETVYVAFTSAIPCSDEQREWFARSAGWYLAASIAWSAGAALALFGSWIMGLTAPASKALVQWLGGTGVLTGVASWLTGASGRTSAHGSPATTVRGSIYGLVAPVAAVLFFAILLALGSAAIDKAALARSFLCVLKAGSADCPKEPALSGAGAAGFLLLAALVTGAVAVIASRYININRFSLHGLYRNRLVRAFLGASHRDRRPDPFTGFDMEDNPFMSELWPTDPRQRSGDAWRPFHVLNLTLNVVSTRNLAWQQRKAMSFTVSPLHSGAGALCSENDQNSGQLSYRGAYRPSSQYGGAMRTAQPAPANASTSSERQGPPDRPELVSRGISLGTAMAISGAAVNPNMGYHSSPVVSLLLTLLNVRLGWWLGNPGPAGDKTWDQNGPSMAAVPLIQEAFGLSTDDRAFVNLSDGGHFENLGLYEMVRRRCRYIVVSDAGCDPGCTFEDLGDSVRKIAIDFGISIDFHDRLGKLRSLPLDIPAGGAPYCAMGIIRYADADGEQAEDGLLLYVKAGYHNHLENAGIRAYANTHPTFPHQTTTDQWFSESQFESYRALGFEIMKSVLDESQMRSGTEPQPPVAVPRLKDVFAGALHKSRSEPSS